MSNERMLREKTKRGRRGKVDEYGVPYDEENWMRGHVQTVGLKPVSAVEGQLVKGETSILDKDTDFSHKGYGINIRKSKKGNYTYEIVDRDNLRIVKGIGTTHDDAIRNAKKSIDNMSR